MNCAEVNSVRLTHAETQQRWTSQGHRFRHSPSTVEVTLSQAAIFGQRRRIEPKCWQALTVAVSLVTIVTVWERAERNPSVGEKITENNCMLVHSQILLQPISQKRDIHWIDAFPKTEFFFSRGISINYP